MRWILLSFIKFGAVLAAQNCLTCTKAANVANIYWNSSNIMFSATKDSLTTFTVALMDNINIFCPVYNSCDSSQHAEVSLLYRVSKYGYDSCSVDEATSEVVGLCNKPCTEQILTVYFREFTPKPGGLEFKSGQTYYFISTSTGSTDGIYNKQGGLCATKHMKLRFHVVERHAQAKIESGSASDQVDQQERSSSRSSEFPQQRLGGAYNSRTRGRGRVFPGNLLRERHLSLVHANSSDVLQSFEESQQRRQQPHWSSRRRAGQPSVPSSNSNEHVMSGDEHVTSRNLYSVVDRFSSEYGGSSDLLVGRRRVAIGQYSAESPRAKQQSSSGFASPSDSGDERIAQYPPFGFYASAAIADRTRPAVVPAVVAKDAVRSTGSKPFRTSSAFVFTVVISVIYFLFVC